MSLLNNSIAYAQFRSRSGWKGMALIAGGYVVVLGGFMALTAKLSRYPADTMVAWTGGLGVIHTLALLFFGTTRVSGSIRQDITTGMVESNRLMPISSTEAVAGYIVGGTSQVLALTA